jgi:hypothetical protein
MKIKDFKLGSTGAFPYGKVDSSDEGEIQIAAATDVRAGIVRLAFGKPVAWLGLPATVARQVGQMLIEKADELDRAKH